MMMIKMEDYIMGESTDAVDKVIANLDRIPKNIDSKIIVKKIVREVSKELQKDLRGRVSYT